MTREQILEQAKSLPPHEREELIEDLRQLSSPDELTAEQMAELERRISAADRGTTQFLPGEAVMEGIRKRLAR